MLVQQHGVKYLVQNRPEKPLNREELDAVYALPYAKLIIQFMKVWAESLR